jgi:thiamine pyrophosphokinase
MPAEGSAVARTAVIVIGGGGIDPGVVARLPADRMVIAADSGLDHAMALGLDVDLLVGDLDSVSEPALAEVGARGTPVERHRPDKDATDTELALAAAVERGYTRLIGVGGPHPDDRRLDHELGVLLAFASAALADREVELWWGPAHVVVLHGPGTAAIDAPPGTIVSLLPVHGAATGITTTGLRYPLRAEPLTPGSGRGISNEVAAAPSASTASAGSTPSPSPTAVHLEAGTLLVIQPLALGGPPCAGA